MELFDYIRFRWLPLALLLVVGVVVIVIHGRSSSGDTYTAQAQMLVRPPTSSQSGYGSDSDKYISTQMALMYTSDYLDAEVVGTDATTSTLARSLSYNHTGGSEIVTLQVRGTNGAKAIALVNAAANGYLGYAQSVEAQPAADEAATLSAQIGRSRKQLAEANAIIKRTVTAYVAANPDDRLPSAESLAPRAAAQANLATTRLQQLLQQQSADAVDDSGSSFRSRLLRAANHANLPKGWGQTTYLAAFGGLILVLLVLAGIGLALTRRVISEARWNAAVARGELGHPVRLRRLTKRQRTQSVRRVQNALAAVGGLYGTTWSVVLPQETKALRRKTAFLVRQLTDSGVDLSWNRPVTEALAATQSAPVTSPVTNPVTTPAATHAAEATDAVDGDPASSPHTVLLLVDLTQATVDDAAVLTDYPSDTQHLMVPVLV